MLRSTLVVQLLTLLLDSQGADPTTLMDVFPEEFTPKVHRADQSHKSALAAGVTSSAWSEASEDLTDSLLFLVERHLVTLRPDGRVVPGDSSRATLDDEPPFSPIERDEGFGARSLYGWDRDPGLCADDRALEFDSPRDET